MGTGGSLKMIKIAFCFILKGLLFLEIFQFLFRVFGHGEKWLGKKAPVTNNFKAHIVRYLKK